MSYADVNGVSLHYEEHGDGAPLVLLHGGFGAGVMFAPILPDLAARRKVITVDLQGHGGTADVDRPIDPGLMADDIAALIEYLGYEQVDLMGYSLGGLTAVRTAIQHPNQIRDLVAVSVGFRRDGSHADVIAQMDAMSRETASVLRQSPLYATYERLGPRPEDWETLVEKVVAGLKVDYDWTDEIKRIRARTLLVYADADSIRPQHIVEFFALLGGGLRDAHWDGSGRPTHQLAILPGHTHYDVSLAPALVPTVIRFLED